jgi:hypothetical protein
MPQTGATFDTTANNACLAAAPNLVLVVMLGTGTEGEFSVHHRHRALITPRAERPRITPSARYRRKDPTGGGDPLRPEPGVPPSPRRGRAVRTARSWRGIVAYAPRAGGAYDSHHRTAGIAGRTRRCGGGVAARGERVIGHHGDMFWRAHLKLARQMAGERS